MKNKQVKILKEILEYKSGSIRLEKASLYSFITIIGELFFVFILDLFFGEVLQPVFVIPLMLVVLGLVFFYNYSKYEFESEEFNEEMKELLSVDSVQGLISIHKELKIKKVDKTLSAVIDSILVEKDDLELKLMYNDFLRALEISNFYNSESMKSEKEKLEFDLRMKEEKLKETIEIKELLEMEVTNKRRRIIELDARIYYKETESFEPLAIKEEMTND